MNINKININQSEQTYYIASDIYDVSAHNNGATFESLSALLSAENLSTLIPTAVRYGGMTIRFVQSSDNKYVQYRLLSNIFSTDEGDWDEVGGTVTTTKIADGAVTAAKLAEGVIVQDIGSREQSVMSQKAVSNKLGDLQNELYTKLPIDSDSDSSISDGSEEFIVTDSANKVSFKVDNKGTNVRVLNICDENGNVVKTIEKALLDKIENELARLDETDNEIKTELYTKLQKDSDSDSSISDGSEEFVITDSANKVSFKVDTEGTKVRVLHICDENGNVVKTITKELLDKIEELSQGVSDAEVTGQDVTIMGALAAAEEAQKTANAAVVANSPITSGTHTKITYDAKGLVTAGEDLTAADIPSIDHSKISDWDTELAKKQDVLVFNSEYNA